jgi:hypothetical protein
VPDQVYIDNQIYTLVKDFLSSYHVLVSGLVRDELTGEAPEDVLSISLQPTHVTMTDIVLKKLLTIKVLASGLFCLAGEPERIFPDLSNTDYTFGLQVHVPGYKDVILPVSIPKNSTFPLPALAPVNMQHLPIRMQGRVVGMTATPAPIASASVLLLDEPNPPTPLTEYVIALRTPLYFPHAVGTTVQQRQLTGSGAAKQLVASVTGGSQALLLNDVTGLAADDVLLIGSDAAGEYVVVDNLPQNVPGQVVLRNALNYSFVVGTAVQKYVRGATGASTTLARFAEAGEGVLFLPGNLPSAATNLIEIADASATLIEYHAPGAITDANGYYRLDGFTRVQTVYMKASAVGFAAMSEPTAWTIDYGRPVNIVDFRLLP